MALALLDSQNSGASSGLSFDDLKVLVSSYQKEISRLKTLLLQLRTRVQDGDGAAAVAAVDSETGSMIDQYQRRLEDENERLRWGDSERGE